MLKISKTASQTLYQELRRLGASPLEGLRLRQDKDGEFTLVLDKPTTRDRVIWHRQRAVLIVNPEIEAAVGNWVLDVRTAA